MITIKLAQEVSFLNKAAIKQTINHLPKNSKVIIDASETFYIDYDVLELFRDFLSIGSKDKGISVTWSGSRMSTSWPKCPTFLLIDTLDFGPKRDTSY